MNGNVGDSTELSSNSTNLLSGESLLRIHVNGSKSLPKDGSKDFSPSGSWMERKQIQSALDERKELISEERVEKWGALASATWDRSKNLAEVTRRIGKHFQTLGFEKEGTLYLYPEEALYLLERNSLELYFGGVPVSIQQGYSLLLGANTGCNISEYRTYSHLVGQGYRLLRFKNQVYTKYERDIRLDQCVPGKQRVKLPRPTKLSEISDTSRVVDIKSENIAAKETLLSEVTEIKKESPSAETLSRNGGLASSIPGPSHSECEEIKIAPVSSVTKQESVIESSILEVQVSQEAKDHNESADREIQGKTSIQGQLEEMVDNHESTSACSSVSVSHTSKGDSEPSELECRKEHRPIDNCHEDSSTGDGTASPIEAAENEAYHIAESLMSLGSVLMEKKSCDPDSEVGGAKPPENISTTLLSEIMKVLGTHFEKSISKETLSNVAAKAADTILNHVSEGYIAESENLKDPKTSKIEISEVVKDSSNNLNEDKGALDAESLQVENDPQSKQDRVEDSEVPMEDEKNDDSEINAVFPEGSSSSESSDLNCILKDFSDEAGKELDSQALKRPLSVDEKVDDCEPMLIKRPKVVDHIESEIEILDVPPKVKDIELVNLSEESSLDSVEIEETTRDNDKIEVIDLNDSSEDESSDSAVTSASSSSESDDPVIIDDRIDDRRSKWFEERKQILDSIPNMYKMSRITLEPPSPDLLPENVEPQRSYYNITRWKLRKDSKQNNTSFHHSEQSLSLPFSNEPHSVPWPQDAHVNPVAAIQTIAQLVLPMLGITPPTAFPPNQIWRPRHSNWRPRQPMWRPPHPMWRPRGPPINQYRPNLRQINHYPRGRAYYHRNSFSNIHPQQHAIEASFGKQLRRDNVLSIQSRRQEETSMTGRNSNWSSWLRSNQKGMKGQVERNCLKNPGRYYCPPKKYKHMKSVWEEGHVSKDSEPEIDSEENEYEGRSMDVQNLNQATCSSSSEDSDSSSEEVKPLLSPHNCTSFESVFQSLQVIKEADTEVLATTVYENPLRPIFDLFSPNKPYRKGNPPSPDYHLCITSHDEEVPDLRAIKVLEKTLSDGVPIMFAIVSPDSISFLQFPDVNLPNIF